LDPFYQYDASEFAHGLGLISLGQRHKLKEMEVKCQALLKGGTPPLCWLIYHRLAMRGCTTQSARKHRAACADCSVDLYGLPVLPNIA
jgi:hypothetical protein